MRGCLQKAKTDKQGLPKGESSWNIILSLGRKADGKYEQKWHRFHGTRQQAEAKLAELVNKINKRKYVVSSKITLGDWLDDWMEKSIKPPRCTQNTYSAYNYIVTKHLKPNLGHIPLQKLTSLDIERYYAAQCAALSERSLVLHHAILRRALRVAVKGKKIEENVALDVENRPKVRRNDEAERNRVWTAEEASRFLSFVQKNSSAQYSTLFSLALETGVRKSELLGLKWKDIEGLTLRVDRQLLGVKNPDAPVLVTSPPKGKRSRSLTLSETLVARLREHKREQSALKLKNRLHYVDLGLVFAQSWEHKCGKHSRLGMPLNKTMLNNQLAKLCRDAGVKRITVHELRHTCATLQMLRGVPAKVVQERLGHSRVEMTLSIYSHVLPAMESQAANDLAELLYR